jgi:hypothetical protein
VVGKKIGETFLTTCRAISKTDLLYWAIASLVSTIGALLTLPALIYREMPSFELAMRSIDVVAYSFVFAIPVFLGASLLLATKGAHQNMVNQSTQGQSNRNLFAHIFALLFVLSSGIIILMTVCSFLLSQFISQLSVSVYILGTILASCLTILILCPMGVLVASVFDDWKISTGLGAGLFLVLAITTGMPSSPAKYTEMAFLGPVQYFRAVATILTGVEFPSELEMINHFGVYFTWESLIVPTAILGSLAGFSLWISRKIFEQNLLVWKINNGLWQVENQKDERKIHEPTTEIIEKARIIEKKRKQIRRYMMLSLILVIFLIPPAGYGYSVYRDASNTYVVYQGQHHLPIGQWLYGEFTAVRPPYPSSLMIRYDIDVSDWDGCPDFLIRQHGCQMMTLQEFELLNDSERWDAGYALGSGLVKPETKNQGSYGLSLYEDVSQMVWAIRFVDTNWNVTSGMLSFSITVDVYIRSQ